MSMDNAQRLTFNIQRRMNKTSRTDSPRITRMTADSLTSSAAISAIRGNGLVGGPGADAAGWSALTSARFGNGGGTSSPARHRLR